MRMQTVLCAIHNLIGLDGGTSYGQCQEQQLFTCRCKSMLTVSQCMTDLRGARVFVQGVPLLALHMVRH